MIALKVGSLATVKRYVMELENQGVLKRSEIEKIIPMPKLKKGNFVLAPLIGSTEKSFFTLENKRMKDIIVDDCNVQGVLTSCIKKIDASESNAWYYQSFRQ